MQGVRRVRGLVAVAVAVGVGVRAGVSVGVLGVELEGLLGELLGDEQSGQIHEIGFSLYTELLERAVQGALRGPAAALQPTGPRLLVRRALAPIERVQEVVQKGLQWWINVPYRRSLAFALDWRYLTVAVAVVFLFLSVSLVVGGFLKFTLMPKVDADNMIAALTMPQGTPAERTQDVLARIERIDDHSDIGAVLAALSGLRDVDHLDALGVEVTDRIAIMAPIAVGSFVDDPSLLQQPLQDQLDFKLG